MKRKISVCIIVFVLVILLIAAGGDRQPAQENRKQDIVTETEDMERMVEASADSQPYAYILLDRDGWVIVVHAENNEIYMETGIMVSCLPDELAAALKTGLGMKDERELFDFLENYSS